MLTHIGTNMIETENLILRRFEYTDNDASAERAIKPFVIGRKKWLFCNTPDGARAF